ncbi:hypothetical protein CXF46_10435 [Corynebacterium bovis]|nr:hypothetical protein CXF38_09990 [Corynebacterium bovis]RRO83352.1 hypothetical protein CXF36_03305 [Corynebacterium bovis]RRO84512.1 hypothetical protein CXF37_03060 [Corynebacterium bovis]RRO91674.1 hypothetical protein CXF45_03195 [Corynebacterium bovis]RRO95043.1 hypothetical protein CXF29_05815 [Corynebacterium bovis]
MWVAPASIFASVPTIVPGSVYGPLIAGVTSGVPAPAVTVQPSIVTFGANDGRSASVYHDGRWASPVTVTV